MYSFTIISRLGILSKQVIQSWNWIKCSGEKFYKLALGKKTNKKQPFLTWADVSDLNGEYAYESTTESLFMFMTSSCQMTHELVRALGYGRQSVFPQDPVNIEHADVQDALHVWKCNVHSWRNRNKGAAQYQQGLCYRTTSRGLHLHNYTSSWQNTPQRDTRAFHVPTRNLWTAFGLW